MVVRSGLWWFIVVRGGFTWWFRGGSWSFVVVFLQKSLEKGHVTLCLTNQRTKFTMKSHFWWDFLFAPFHLKSIPLKSSAKNPTKTQFTTNKTSRNGSRSRSHSSYMATQHIQNTNFEHCRTHHANWKADRRDPNVTNPSSHNSRDYPEIQAPTRLIT